MRIALGLILLLFQAMQVQEPMALAQQAQAAYVSGDYAAARGQYEAIINLGVHDSAIYINLGNTYFQLHDMGRALLNYRRAQVIAPRDTLLNAHLARVRSTRLDVQGDETVLVDSLAALTTSSLTGDELRWLAFSLWGLFFSVVLVAIVRVRWRDILRGPLIVLGIALLWALILWGSRSYATQYRHPAVILEDQVQVMSGPGEDYLPLYDLHAAAEVRILEQRGDWVRFALPDQQQGWVRREALESV